MADSTNLQIDHSTPWHATAVESVIRELAVAPDIGLGASEVATRLERWGENKLRAAKTSPAWQRFLRQFADPLIYLLIAAVIISLVAWIIEGATGVPIDSVVIIAIIVLNAIIGFVQEERASKAVAALQDMTAPTAKVIRAGQRHEVPSASLVPGDIVLLEEGDTVPADARLLSATNLLVGESSLTGESVPVEKVAGEVEADAPLAERTNMVFASTAVAQGVGRAVVCATGMRTEVGRIAELLDSTNSEPTPLEREIAGVGKALTVLVIIVALVVMATVYFITPDHSAASLITILLLGVSLAVAAVPEGLPAILSMVLALGVQRMASHNAIVKRLNSVETLGSATVICSDKTGTLTRNEMTIEEVATVDGSLALSTLEQLDDEVGGDVDEYRKVLVLGSIANNAEVRSSDVTSDRAEIIGDPTEAAFHLADRRLSLALPEFDRVREVPFSSARKRMTVVVRTRKALALVDDASGGNDPSYEWVIAKGAPDVLIERCTRVRTNGSIMPLTDEHREQIAEQVERLSALAYRTLAVAARPAQAADLDGDDEQVESDLIWVGVVGIVDPPRAEAGEAVAEAHAAGIRVVMITGDHPTTATRIATDLGIIEPITVSDPATATADLTRPPLALTGRELDALNADQFAEAVRTVSVFARVAPEHKLRIVETLRAQGNIVSMTGDGVNDAPALKTADIGVAMGITGTQVTREAADMILADDNFATIVSAVREGRGIFANIRKFLRYLLSSNMGEVLTMLLGVALGTVLGLRLEDGTVILPLLATQILWINLLTDSLPALSLGVDPVPRDVMSAKPRRLTDRVINGEMWSTIVFVGVVMAVATLLAFDWFYPGGLLDGPHTTDEAHARTVAFTVLVFAQLFNVLNCRSELDSAFVGFAHNRWLWGAVALSILLQVLVIYVPVLNHAFGTVPLDLEQWLIAIVLASSVLWLDELRKIWLRARARKRTATASPTHVATNE